LAIAGSTAQSRIQAFPADADFFERVHITAPTRDEARSVLADLIRTTALDAGVERGYRLQEVLLGIVRGHQLRWTPEEVAAGHLRRQLPSGDVVEVVWRRAVEEPGFVKIDWTLLNRDLGGPMHVSKVVDATWAAPNGAIHSLDGAIDADYQQVYLDGRAAELTAELMSGLWEASREQYVRQMEREVVRYVAGQAQDYVKVASCLYNLCRVTGRFAEALFLRELFDEPMARLHQARVQFDLAHHLGPEELCELAADLAELAIEMRDWSAGPHLDALIRWASQPAMEDVAPVQQAFHVLGQAIAEAGNRAFDERLRAYPPITSILDDIRGRYEPRSR
jgi:hypothetical protein